MFVVLLSHKSLSETQLTGRLLRATHELIGKSGKLTMSLLSMFGNSNLCVSSLEEIWQERCDSFQLHSFKGEQGNKGLHWNNFCTIRITILSLNCNLSLYLYLPSLDWNSTYRNGGYYPSITTQRRFQKIKFVAFAVTSITSHQDQLKQRRLGICLEGRFGFVVCERSWPSTGGVAWSDPLSAFEFGSAATESSSMNWRRKQAPFEVLMSSVGVERNPVAGAAKEHEDS